MPRKPLFAAARHLRADVLLLLVASLRRSMLASDDMVAAPDIYMLMSASYATLIAASLRRAFIAMIYVLP